MACCTEFNSNTGKASLQEVFGVGIRHVYVPIIASDGTRNGIPKGQDLSTYFTDQVNNADSTKRWYPVGNFKNPEDTRADASFETFDDDSRVKLRDGIRTFSGFITGVPAAYTGKIKRFECDPWGVFAIDTCGNLYGQESADGQFLYPQQIGEKSFSAQYQHSSNPATARIRVNFDFSRTVTDSSLAMIEGDLWGEDILNIDGIVDVDGENVSNVLTTGFDVDLLVLHTGSFKTKIPAEGWLLSEFTLVNTTQDASIVITSVTPSATVEGRYTFVIPAQNASDVLSLTGQKSGFELRATTINIP